MTSVLTYILILVEAIVCFLLISIILVQRTKSQGVGMAFGAGMGETLFGSHIGNVLTKTTIILGIVFLVNTTILAMLGSRSNKGISSVTDSVPVAVAPVQVPVPQDPAQLPMSTEALPVVNVDDNIAVETAPVTEGTVELPTATQVKPPVAEAPIEVELPAATEEAAPVEAPTM